MLIKYVQLLILLLHNCSYICKTLQLNEKISFIETYGIFRSPIEIYYPEFCANEFETYQAIGRPSMVAIAIQKLCSIHYILTGVYCTYNPVFLCSVKCVLFSRYYSYT